ncbi:hypothetical protein BC834DRAFT_389859 [Gloeopeniophorella convolvens]|nr:hypothetical protein BC834DRAFT_389859 [Gloeopeniophorella convolvens]
MESAPTAYLCSAATSHRLLGDKAAASAQRQMLTPDSSPMVARRWALHEGDTTPTKKRKTPPRTPPPIHPPPMKVESPNGNGIRIDSLPASSPPTSTLSSPFMQKTLSAEQNSSPRPPPSPTPIRTAGGEIARIRADEASARATQQRLTEARRPEYLRRVSRADAASGGGSADTMPGLGIAETPVKGRRIELWGFQETSEESFEERLMAGGYGGYGSTAPDGVVGPRPATPPAGAASRALEWANSFTPGGPRPSSSSAAAPEDPHPAAPLDEREAKKQRRLEAFRHVHARTKTSLHPVEVEGKGRVLLDVGTEEASDLLDELQSSAAGKRRGGRRRRRGGPGSRGGRARGGARMETRPPRVREGVSLNWPDEEFPWSVRTHERRELEAAEEADRMQWIGRFLDEESDAESGEEMEDEDVMPMRLEPVSPRTAPVPRGRGKMVPLSHRDGLRQQKIFIPSDPADARAALLSKQSVRALAQRRRSRAQPSGAEGEVLCICRGRDDGRELVQCDDCRTWYHLECLGIEDTDLGREEDPWYCHNCMTLMNGAASSEPIFAPALAEEDPPHRRRRDPLFFSTLQESPAGGDWPIPLHGPGPSTPKAKAARRRAAPETLTHSSWGSQQGPQTPRSDGSVGERVRVYATPGTDERIFQADGSPFDPTSTPSRGVHLGASASSAFATPKWQVRVPPLAYVSSPYDSAGGGAGGAESSSPYRMFPYEDTPVDRTAAPQPPVLPSKRVQESPLMGRGSIARGHMLDVQGSPVPLGRKGKERQGVGRR